MSEKKIGEPFGPWASFEICVADMRKHYVRKHYDEETAKRVCGALKKRLEGKTTLDEVFNELINSYLIEEVEKKLGIQTIHESFQWIAPLTQYKAETPGKGKFFQVKAIYAGVSGNKNVYTREELKAAARSLAERPLNINHDEARTLPPPNRVVDADYEDGAVETVIYVEDPETLRKLTDPNHPKAIEKVSVEAKARETDKTSRGAEHSGIVFTGLGLLERGVAPGMPETEIRLFEKLMVMEEKTKMETEQKSPYINPDGTFKGGFDGCVKHMMTIKGLPEENARKLCAYIGRKAGKI